MSEDVCPMCGAALTESGECRACGESPPSPFELCREHPFLKFLAIALLGLPAVVLFYMICLWATNQSPDALPEELWPAP